MRIVQSVEFDEAERDTFASVALSPIVGDGPDAIVRRAAAGGSFSQAEAFDLRRTLAAAVAEREAHVARVRAEQPGLADLLGSWIPAMSEALELAGKAERTLCSAW